MKLKRKNKLQEETAERTNRGTEQSLSDGTRYHMACSISSRERRRAHCGVDTKKKSKSQKTNKNKQTSDLKQQRQMKTEVKDGGRVMDHF